MILSKANLKIVDIASVDKAIPVLNNVHICGDGTTVASNGKVILAVSPVKAEVKKAVPIKESNPRDTATVSGDTVKEILKNMPKDTMFKGLLEHTDFNSSDGSFSLNDGKRSRTIFAKLYDRAYIEFRKIFKRAAQAKSLHRVVLNRKRLINLLQTLDAVCADSSGESPIFVDLTDKNNIIVRAVNNINGQRALGIMTAYKGEESKWMQPNLWEKKITGMKMAKKIVLKN